MNQKSHYPMPPAPPQSAATLRDQFAMAALTMLGDFGRDAMIRGEPHSVAALAFQLADAMLKAREA